MSHRPVVVLMVALLCASSAFAGWSVTYLKPTGSSGSVACGISQGKQVGYTYSASGETGGLWNGTSDSWRSLNASTMYDSVALAIYGRKQVGRSSGQGTGGQDHACMWNGTAGSWVDLNPSGCTGSTARGIYGTQQVGEMSSYTYSLHACLWNGTASSNVDLNPAGCSSSSAYGVYDGKQVGEASGTATGNLTHASLWNGTAASWVDLSPLGSTSSSASAVYGEQQVGHAAFNGHDHAGYWTGTADSWVDLNPAGFESSQVQGVCAGMQVGSAWGMNGDYRGRAGIWSGTADSWIDLQSLLKPGLLWSGAQGIEVIGGEIWVVGSAYSAETNSLEAVMWHYVPEPSSILTLGMGLLGLPLLRRRR